MYTQGDKYMKY